MKGYTLIEVVLSVALLALIFIPGFMLLNDNLLTERVSEERTIYAHLAEQKMEELVSKRFGELYAKIPSNSNIYEEEERDLIYNGYMFNRKIKIIAQNSGLIKLIVTVEGKNDKGGSVTIATFKGKFN